MDKQDSMSDANPAAKFYLPATFQTSNRPSFLERHLTRIFRDRSEMILSDTIPRAAEFYLPGTIEIKPTHKNNPR